MRAIISGADERLTRLRSMLAETGMDVQCANALQDFESKNCLIAKYPFDALTRDGLTRMDAGANLFLLNACPVPDDLSEKYRAHALMDDMVFVNENATLTAEGALFCAMKDNPSALTCERVGVVGYGRIGRALTEMLVGLGAKVTVFSRRESGRLQAMARGAYGASAEKMHTFLNDLRVIFVTSPERMLSGRELSYVSPSARVIDLSGPPYGVDIEAAREMGVNARRESALPGRYAPESAARCMYRAIMRIIAGGERE